MILGERSKAVATVVSASLDLACTICAAWNRRLQRDRAGASWNRWDGEDAFADLGRSRGNSNGEGHGSEIRPLLRIPALRRVDPHLDLRVLRE
jgi:hypothetical protein